MNTVNVKIDITTPKGRKIARELYGQKEVEIENPVQSEITGETYEVDEVFDRLLDRLKEYYEGENSQSYEKIQNKNVKLMSKIYST